MGQLVDGKWEKGSIIHSDDKGSYDRKPRNFRYEITPAEGRFQAESGRYHLYVSYACPWATRALIMRHLKGLTKHISLSVVHPHMLDYGWNFDSDFPGATGDDLYGKSHLYEIYQKADPDVTTSVTVPVLWDKKQETIVNNESSEIIRIFNTAFNGITGDDTDYYPETLKSEIDGLNEDIYHNVNNGVYKAGFAQNQQAYDQAVTNIFHTLDKLDDRLADRKYLTGDQLTEADIRLVPSLLRFDPVYYVHFKANVRKISEYENLRRYLKDMYAIAAVRETTHFDHIKHHYYYSHKEINPFRIIPKGPAEIIM